MVCKRFVLALVFLGLLFSASSCKPQLVGADAGVYSGGKLWAIASEELKTVYIAANEAVNDLELKVDEDKSHQDVFSGRIVARSADGKRVLISLKPRSDGMTDLSISVSPFGNRSRSKRIYEQIQKHLGKAEK